MQKDIFFLEKSRIKVCIRSLFFTNRRAVDKFHQSWKTTGFWDTCSGNFTEILNPILEFLLKMGTLKVGTSPSGRMWYCPLPPPPPPPRFWNPPYTCSRLNSYLESALSDISNVSVMGTQVPDHLFENFLMAGDLSGHILEFHVERFPISESFNFFFVL